MIEHVIEYLPPADLTPDPENPMGHPGENRAAVLASFERFGQVEPIIVQKSTMQVVSGNLRREVAIELGMDRIGCIVADMTNAEARAYSIAANQSARLGSWNDEVLARHVATLADIDRSLVVGFDDAEIERHRALANPTVPDFQPVGVEEQGRLDQIKPIVCPECGHEFQR